MQRERVHLHYVRLRRISNAVTVSPANETEEGSGMGDNASAASSEELPCQFAASAFKSKASTLPSPVKSPAIQSALDCCCQWAARTLRSKASTLPSRVASPKRAVATMMLLSVRVASRKNRLLQYVASITRT